MSRGVNVYASKFRQSASCTQPNLGRLYVMCFKVARIRARQRVLVKLCCQFVMQDALTAAKRAAARQAVDENIKVPEIPLEKLTCT